jgi:AsmA protein
MGSAKKIGFVSLSTVILIILVLMFALPHLLDMDQARLIAEEQATKAIGRQVTISRAGLSLLPIPYLRLEDISAADPPGGGTVSDMRMSSLELGLTWSSLLKGRVQVNTITAVEPGVTLLIEPGDVWNLQRKGEIVVGSLLSGIRFASEAALDKGLPVKVSLSFADIKVKGGEVVLRDLSGKVLNKDISFGGIDAAFTYISPEVPLKFNASINLPDSHSTITANGTIGPMGEGADAGNIPLEIFGKAVDLKLTEASVPVKDIPLAVSGTFRSEGTVSGTLVQGFQFRQKAEFSDVKVSSDKGFAIVQNLGGSMIQAGNVNLADNLIELDRFEFTAGDALFLAKGAVSHNGILPHIDMTYESNRIDLADFVKYFPDLEKRISVKGDLTIVGQAKGTPNKDLLATMDLASSSIEMDRGPLLMESNSDPDQASVEAQELTDLLPPSLPMSVSARISVPRGRFEWVTFSDLTAGIRIKNRWASLDKMIFSAFGGRLTGSSWFNMRELPASYGNDIQIRDMEIDQFLAAFAGLKGIMHGKAALDLFVSGRGVNMDQFKETTLGLGKFSIASGKYTPANFLKGALKVASLPISDTLADQTEFDSMESTIAVRGGKINFTELTCTAADWVLNGSGIIGLDQSLSLRYFMTLSDSVSSAIDKDKQEYLPRDDQGHLQIPFKLSRTFTSPEFSLDSKAMEKVVVNRKP